MNRTSRNLGFTMPEMLIVLILVGLVAAAGGELFQSTIRAAHAAGESQDAASSVDAAVAAVRADVWGASAIDVAPGGKSVTVKWQADRSVTWTIGNDGTLVRREAADVPTRQWTLGARANFTANGPELMLRIPGTKSSSAGEIRLTSQVQLLRRLAS